MHQGPGREGRGAPCDERIAVEYRWEALSHERTTKQDAGMMAPESCSNNSRTSTY